MWKRRVAGAPAERSGALSLSFSFATIPENTRNTRAFKARYPLARLVVRSVSQHDGVSIIKIIDAMNLTHAEVQVLCGFVVGQIEEVGYLPA
jgi:hypothetical protein